MKVRILYVLTILMVLSLTAQAQMFSRGNTSSVSAKVATPKEAVSSKSAQDTAAFKQEALARQQINAEIDAMLAEEAPPTTMTIEQKAEIDSDARDDVHMSVRKQTVKDRKLILGAMDSAARIQKKREALSSGESNETAAKVAAEIESPKVNTKSDNDMEKYLFEKAGINIVKNKKTESSQSDER